MMRKLTILATAALAVLPYTLAVAAELAGKWTTDGRYVFSFDGAREHTGERAYRAELKRVP